MDQISRWLREAEKHLMQGHLPQAEVLCKRILARQPRCEEARMLLGTVYLQQAKPAAAIECYERVSADAPGTLSASLALGMAHQVRGELEQAVLSFEMALELNSDSQEAHTLLVHCLLRLGRSEEAQRHTEPEIRAQARSGSLPQAPKEAPLQMVLDSSVYTPRLAYRPRPIGAANVAEAAYCKGVDALMRQDFPAAEFHFRRAVRLRPNYPDALLNLGASLQHQGQFQEAMDTYQGLLAIRDDNVDAYDNLGSTLQSLDRYEEAFAAHEKSIALNPNASTPYNNLGVLSGLQNRDAESLAYYRRAVENDPRNVEARYHLGMQQLSMGLFEEGWQNHEARLDPSLRPTPLPQRSRWDGRVSLKDKSILVCAEQGLGDTIQFVRYLPWLKQLGARIFFVYPASLYPLFERAPTIDQHLDPDALGRTTVGFFDYHIDLMSLPLLHKTRLESIPAETPYLQADPERISFWRRYFQDFAGLRIGIAWAGNPKYRSDCRRSCRLTQFAPLAEIPDITLFSLQKGEATAQLDSFPNKRSVIDLSERLVDFGETAAAMVGLDLILTVDTSIAHLAGALGRPVWTLLPYSADWRWLDARSDSPWYPSMRLYRQPAHNDWDTLFALLVPQLQALASSPRS